MTIAALATTVFIQAQATEYVDWVEWDRIEHWAGDPDGEHKCALVIDFQDGQSDQSYVWGYRWNGTKTGEDLVRAVASQSSILTAMIQYTGTMGSTLNALGISANREELDYLHYDFDRAAIGGEVSFDYFTPNTSMGQDTAPGYDTPDMCAEAIGNARETGIIEHPLNAFVYGYPAYDYDYWQLEDGYADSYEYRWRSGWYEGYWSYWHGPNDYDYMSYSGLGMSSTVLVDGGVQAWKYIYLNGAGYGDAGGELNQELNYDMGDYGESMHEAPAIVQPVNQENVKFWVGNASDEKAATVIFQFNDGKGADNIVYGYRWTGGWDDALSKVLENISKADPRLTVSNNGGNLSVSFDLDDDGKLTDADHLGDTEGYVWNCYVKRTVDPSFNKINSARWLNPNAVMIVSCQPADMATVSLPYQLMRPAVDPDMATISVPEQIDYTLADDNLTIPMLIEVPDGGKLSTGFTWTKPAFVSTVTTSSKTYTGTVTAYSGFQEGPATLKVRGSYTPAGAKAQYVYSNEVTVNFSSPERPITSIHFENEAVSARLNHEVENSLVYEPADATYTKIKYSSSDTKVASASAAGVVKTTKTAGESVITAAYDFNSDITATYALTSALQVPVTDITLEGADENNVITLTPKEMIGILPQPVPADPDIAEFNVTLSGNGNDKTDYVATTYKVRVWDEKNVMSQFFELSGHRVGEALLTIESTDGSGVKKEFTVNIVEPEREPAIDYNEGTIMLNEEWFGHTNGGLNWYSPDYDVVYQAYERENPGMSFGCTSQYGIVYEGKLFVSSKQATDNGDPLPGGGRLVVADASTLKRLGSIDNIMIEGEAKSGDGRALCGAGPGRIYMGTHQGIYIIDTENFAVIGKISGSGEEGTNLYNSQVGDMVLAKDKVFAICQSKGVLIINTATDEVVKEIADVNVQGITQSADGTVWYATFDENKCSNFVAIDINTLEEVDRVTVPIEVGTVSCGWGAWRTTQFTGAQSVNSLFFAPGSNIANGGGGVYYRYDIDSREFKFICSIANLEAHTPTVKQGAYGSIRYDDRNGCLLIGTTEFKASGHYRWNWTHVVDAETGEFVKTVELRPYYWFQSMPIFPDKYEPEFEDPGVIVVDINDGAAEIALKATDRDNNDTNIRYSLVADRGEDAAKIAEVALEGDKLTITPLTTGSLTAGLCIESNGKTVTRALSIEVKDRMTGIDDITAAKSIYTESRNLIVKGYKGTTFSIVNETGVVVDSFTAASDSLVRPLSLTGGVYIVVADNGEAKKIILK